MGERITYFVDVMLPLALPDLFTYRVPFERNEDIDIGKRVVVQFGKKKIYSALIRKIHTKAPEHYAVKYILEVIDDQAVVNDVQLKFWDWMADYYMSTRGEVMNAALPGAMKLASETRIILNPDFDGNTDALNDREFLIFEALQNNEVLTLTEVSEIVELKQVVFLLKNLYSKGVILEEQEMRQKFVPRKEAYLSLHPQWQDEEKMSELINTLEKKAPKQSHVLMTYLQLSEFVFNHAQALPVSKKALLHRSESTDAIVKALVEKEILVMEKQVVSRLYLEDESADTKDIRLSKVQKKAFLEIQQGFDEHNVLLLHGVTGSGKTEIYIKLIQEQIDQGKQVLYLLPEIALTGQIINRLRMYFGKRVGVYHSRYSQNERVEVWNKLLSEDEGFDIVIGARSAVFLPYTRLGLVIVDEEHDNSYKQYDPAPRYHGRDSAIYLSILHGGKCLLGSATPSIETYYKASNHKYGLVELAERFGDLALPEVKIVDTRYAQKTKQMRSHFSLTLLDAIKETLERKEQVILFRNRRGFSLRLVCDKCSYTPQCKNCDVTLTYHKGIQKLKCHYCGYTQSMPEHCPSCGSKRLHFSGYGTEKIEDELPVFFPKANIGRMDLDTTRGKNAYMQIIRDFEERRLDILVGTQMLTKGLDFAHVGLVGVLNADNLLSFPDFRTSEKGFQMLTQVSGRAGRKNRQGKVLIQSSMPENAVIQDVIQHDFQALYQRVIQDRKTFHYPPFYRLIRVEIKHKEAQELNEAAQIFAELLRRKLGGRVIGPEFPLVGRIKNYFIKHVLIKYEAEASRRFVKDYLKSCIEEMDKDSHFRRVLFHVDVDPV